MKISKNTVNNDLYELRQTLPNIDITYSRQSGFYLDGDEIDIRAKAFEYITFFLYNDAEFYLYYALFHYKEHLIPKIRASLNSSVMSSNLRVVPSRFEEITYFIAFLSGRISDTNISLSTKDKSIIQGHKSLEVAEDFIDKVGWQITTNNFYYVGILVQVMTEGNEVTINSDYFFELVEKLITEFERIGAVIFDKRPSLKSSLYNHLIPAYFRTKYLKINKSPLHNRIIEQYSEIYKITELSLLVLEKELKIKFNSAEVGYFTIIFGSHLGNSKSKNELRAAVICPSGISSSLILKTELKGLFPEIEFIDTLNLEEFDKQVNQNRYDLVFSTVGLDTQIPTFNVSPVLSEFEKKELREDVNQEFFGKVKETPTVRSIVNMILPYVEIKQGLTEVTLTEKVYKEINSKSRNEKVSGPMLSDLLTKETINFSNKKCDWKEAVNLAAKPLLDQDKINQNYIDEMIKRVEENGPFIDLGFGIALPHARPEDGVNELGMSLLKLSKGTNLLNDSSHKINIFIVLAAVDNEMHLRALSELTTILTDDRKIKKFQDAESAEEIIEIIKEEEKES